MKKVKSVFQVILSNGKSGTGPVNTPSLTGKKPNTNEKTKKKRRTGQTDPKCYLVF